jgi:hypothetical protein
LRYNTLCLNNRFSLPKLEFGYKLIVNDCKLMADVKAACLKMGADPAPGT